MFELRNNLSVVVLAAAITGSHTAATFGFEEFFDHAAFEACAPPTVVISFDELESGDAVLTGDEFAGEGLTIVHRNGGPINVVQNLVVGSYGGNFVTEANINTLPNVISSSIRERTANQDADNFDFVFDPPVVAAGLFIGNLGECRDRQTVVRFLDETGQELGREVIGQLHVGVISGDASGPHCGDQLPFDNRVFYGARATAAIIKTIRVQNGPNDGDGITFDDVQFGGRCVGDLDGTDDVGFSDVLIVLGAWGACGECCLADLDRSGDVGFADVLRILSDWGPCR